VRLQDRQSSTSPQFSSRFSADASVFRTFSPPALTACALTEFRLLPMYRDAFPTLILRMSPDEVGDLNGWKFHGDGIHLNRRGG